MKRTQADIMLDLMDEKTSLGIEFGSTRIKAVLIDSTYEVIATGTYDWENQLVDGYWTYSLEEILKGLRTSYRQMATEVFEKYGHVLTKIGSIGISAMMHGFLAFNQAGELLTPFRTWRNNNTTQAAEILTEQFQFNIPERWSIAHLYQAILDQEAYVPEMNFFTTLAGYLHWQLTGNKVLGIGDASGMFPIDSKKKDYRQDFITRFEALIAEKNYSWQVVDLLPKIQLAGEVAGHLTTQGAYLLDPTGQLQPGIPFCPPEGDAGTGMVATNSVAPNTGNVSAGTSAFAMIVLENGLNKVHREIDMVTTPSGAAVAMVHTNNCTSEINAWMRLFTEVCQVNGLQIHQGDLYTKLFNLALLGDDNCGKLLSYGYHSGENITKIVEGRPLLVRSADSKFTLANFMKNQIYSAFATMKIGMDLLLDEGITIEHIVGHGGIFKTPGVAQRILSAALQAPVGILATAGEGGAWGMALLAAYTKATEQSLSEFLQQQVFVDNQGETLMATPEEIASFQAYTENYQAGLKVEALASDLMK